MCAMASPATRPARVRAALRELGLADAQAAAHRRAADRRRVVRHLAHRHRARPGVRQARAGASCAWPPTGARRSSATATRRAGCRWPTPRCPAARPQVLGQHAQLGVLVMSYLPPAEHPLWKQQLRDGDARCQRPRARSAPRWGASTRHSAARPELAASSPPTRSSSTSASNRTCWPLRGAIRTWRMPTCCAHWSSTTQSHACALVHGDVSPKNILVGADRAGVPRRRMRLVGRSGLRPRLLPEPPAAEVPVDTGRARRISSRCFDALADGYLAQVDWEPRAALERRAAALLPGLLLARVDGKSPVEYITDASRSGELVRRGAGDTAA